VNIGLIGGGNISNTHARAALAISGVKIASVYGTNKDKVDQLCRDSGAKPYDDFERFLSHRPMEMVVIGSPSGLHASQGIAAARHGLHVLVEKPIDISIDRADALISACRQAAVKLAVIFQDSFKADICRLRKFIEQGSLGKPLLIDARVKWYRPREYYRDFGLWSMTSHPAVMAQMDGAVSRSSRRSTEWQARVPCARQLR
jgi:predicted dehydrogenase